MHSGHDTKELTPFQNFLRHTWNAHVDEIESWEHHVPNYSMQDYFRKYKWWLKREFRHQRKRAQR